MRDEPADLSCDLVAGLLGEHWGLRAVTLTYAPVGFGSYHWIASEADGRRWFVTANYLSPHGDWLGPTAEHVRAGVEAAALVSTELAERGYEFVVAPLADRTGRLVRQVLPSWMLQVLPYLDGGRTPDDWEDPAERQQIAGIVGRLHAAAPPQALQRWDFAVPGRATLRATLEDLDRPWTSGPYAEPTRLRLAGARAEILARFARYDALAHELAASDEPWVVTHGEPHSGNVVRTKDGRMHLVDWDTVKLGPRERDLAHVLDGPGDVLPSYQAQAGEVSARPAAIELFELWWSLAETCGYVQLFREPHADSLDSRESWQNLTMYVPG